MKVFSIYLTIILCFLASSLFNDHPNKNSIKSSLESNSQVLQTVLKEVDF